MTDRFDNEYVTALRTSSYVIFSIGIDTVEEYTTEEGLTYHFTYDTRGNNTAVSISAVSEQLQRKSL